MPEPKTTASIYLLPGMRAKVKVPGYYIGQGTRRIRDEEGAWKTVELVQGFAVQYEDVGTLEAIENEPAVIYTHKKFGLNKVYFFARTGEASVLDIIAVPIHDHSSIVTGGPSYGTYYTDEETT